MITSLIVTDNIEKLDLSVENMNEPKEHKPQAIVEVVDFGPLKITGKFILKDTKRNKEVSAEFIELCRCGRSKNIPYCDGSHEK